MSIIKNGTTINTVKMDSVIADSNNPVKNSAINTYLNNNPILSTTAKGIAEAINELKTLLDNAPLTIQGAYNLCFPIGCEHFGFSAPVVPTGVTATWTLQTSYNGKCLYITSDSSKIGEGVAEELPNIKGGYDSGYSMWYLTDSGSSVGSQGGAFLLTNQTGGMSDTSSGSRKWTNFGFNASRASSIYKDGGHVKCAGNLIGYWKRTA